MLPLLRICREVLDDVNSSAALKAIAGAALLAAFEEDVVVPAETRRAVWKWLRSSTLAYFNTDAFAAVEDGVIRADALSMLAGRSSGANERRLAAQVLCGAGHARHLDDRTLMDLVERATTGAAALDVAGVVSAAHHARGVQEGVLIAIRDRWTTGSISAKEAAASVGFLLPSLDLTWLNRLLSDEEPDVRTYIAYQLESEAPSCAGVMDLLRAQLDRERSPDVRAALLRAVAAQDEAEVSSKSRRRRHRR